MALFCLIKKSTNGYPVKNNIVLFDLALVRVRKAELNKENNTSTCIIIGIRDLVKAGQLLC